MGWGEVPADETTTPGQVLWHSALEYHGQSPSDAVNTDRERAGSSCLCCEGPVKTFVCKATTTFEGEGWVTGDLEHEAVAGHERGDHRVEHVVKGVVPGHDGPHDAHGHHFTCTFFIIMSAPTSRGSSFRYLNSATRQAEGQRRRRLVTKQTRLGSQRDTASHAPSHSLSDYTVL